MARYLVPRPIRRGYEFAPGIGMPEVLVMGAGVAVGGAVFAGLALLGVPWLVRAPLFVLLSGIGVGSVVTQVSDAPLYRRAYFMWQWHQRGRRWLYDFRYPTDY